MRVKRILPLVLGLSVIVPIPGARAADAGVPPDYRDTAGLSQPTHQTVREQIRVPMRDGMRLFAEVIRPVGAGRYPVILELSPYNGGAAPLSPGGRTGYLPGVAAGLAGYFAPRGYAVVLADLRGTGESDGCMNYMGPVDRLDAYDLIEWLGSRSWSDGRVGMTGVSYVGSTPIFAAAARPPSLKTIVPVAGIAQMYDHQFQAGVPYSLQWLGPAAYYDATADPPYDLTDPRFARTGAEFGCGAPDSALVNHADLVTGRYTAWHAARDFRDAATAADIPIFLVQGFPDGSVRPAATEWFFKRDRAGDKAWLGQWGHDATNRHEQWRGVLHRWFDKHLMQRDVDTGPPVEVFLNGGDRPIDDETYLSVPPTVRTAARWPSATSSMTFYPWPDGSLRTEVPPATTVLVPVSAQRGGMSFQTDPFERDIEFTGTPRASITLALPDGRRIDVHGILFDGNYQNVRLGASAMNPELRNGLGTIEPISPGAPMTLTPPGQPLDRRVLAGSSLRFKIDAKDSDKVPTFAGPGVFALQLGGATATKVTIDIVEGATYHPDPAV